MGVINNFLATRTTIVGPLAIFLSIVFGLFRFKAFLLLDASACFVSGREACHSRVSLTFFSSWTNEHEFDRP